MSEALVAWNGYAFDVQSAGPLGLSGESGGTEGLASTATDVYRVPAPGPSAPKPPGQPAIGGRLV